MEQLDRLLASGQNAIGISAQLSWYFRRFGMAAHLIEQSEHIGAQTGHCPAPSNKLVSIAIPSKKPSVISSNWTRSPGRC